LFLQWTLPQARPLKFVRRSRRTTSSLTPAVAESEAMMSVTENERKANNILPMLCANCDDMFHFSVATRKVIG